MRHYILLLVLLSVVLSGCMFWAAEEENITENVTPPPPPPPVKPSFSITSPLSGEFVMVPDDSADIAITLSTQNLDLKPPGGGAEIGEGHFGIIVDGGPVTTFASKAYTISDLPVGTHTVEVELLNNDGTSYSPRITQQVTFTLEKERPPEYVPKEYTVTIKDFDYDPAEITVKVSDSITFVNEGAYPRSATCFLDGKEIFDTKVLATGESAKITLTKVMECEYYSSTHRAMTGMVIVESNEGW